MRRLILFFVVLTLILTAVQVSIADAAERIRMGMINFESKAPGVSHSQASIITDLFTRSLAASRTISILEREQIKKIGEELRFNMSGLVDMSTAVEIGRIKGLQYMVFGAVTELSEKASGFAAPVVRGIAVGGGSREAKATIDIRVVDVATSEIVLALSESGTSSNSTSAVSIRGFSYAESEFGGLQARAIAEAVEKLSHQIRASIGGESSHVVSVSGGNVTIDLGSTMGAKEGNLYLVYADGRSIQGMYGESIGREKINLAIIKITSVSASHSTCNVVPEGGSISMIRRGDKIEPIASRAAKNVKFASSRPAASSETYDQLTGGANTTNSTSVPPAPPAEKNTDSRLAEIAGTNSAPPPNVVTHTPPPSHAPVNAQPQPGGRRDIPGFDPDTSTDAKVISTYGIDPGLANMLSIKHRSAYNKFNGKRYREAYEEFKALVDDYNGNYLSAYWAGRAAHSLRKNDESLEWMEFALAINPNYKPAADFKKNTLRR